MNLIKTVTLSTSSGWMKACLVNQRMLVYSGSEVSPLRKVTFDPMRLSSFLSSLSSTSYGITGHSFDSKL